MSDLITPDHDFMAVVQLIEAAKQRASRAVNTELIDLYWAVGEYVSQKLSTEAWGKGTVEALADYIQRRQPGLRGFSAKNIWRMPDIQRAVLETIIAQGRNYVPFSEASMRAYASLMQQEKVSTPSVQAALDALREKGLVWRAAYGDYALEDESLASWYKTKMQGHHPRQGG